MIRSLLLKSAKHSRRASLITSPLPKISSIECEDGHVEKTVKRSRNAKNRVPPYFKACWIGAIPQQRDWLLAMCNGWRVVAVVRCCPCSSLFSGSVIHCVMMSVEDHREKEDPQPDFAITCWRLFFLASLLVCFLFFYKRRGVTNACSRYQMPSLGLFMVCLTSVLE